VAIVLIAAVAGAFVAWRAGYLGGNSSSRSASAQSPGAVMTTLGTYLARSASVRPVIQPAIDGVRTCSQTPASGQATMQRAMSTRQEILNGLRTLSPSGLSDGTQMIGALTAAMRQSVTADRHYQNWMADYACGSDPGHNAEYLAGQDASAKATAAKKAFLDIWNPMAPRYGQKTYSYQDF
jgi:hypothetical protein